MIEKIKKFLSNKIMLYLVSRYLVFGVQFVVSLYVVSRLSRFDYGRWSFFSMLVALLGNFHFGFGTAINVLLVQHKNDQKLCTSYVSSGLYMVGATCLIPLGLIVAVECFHLQYFETYRLGHNVFLVAAAVAAGYFCNYLSNVFRVRNRILELTVFQSLPVFVTMTMVLIFRGERLLQFLFLGTALSSALSLAFFLIRRDFALEPRFSKELAGQIFHKGILLFLYNAAFLFILLSTKMLVSCYYPVEEFGSFALGYNLANVAVLLSNAIMILIYPRMVDRLSGADRESNMRAIEFIRRVYITFSHGLLYASMIGFYLLFIYLPKYQGAYRSMVMLSLVLLMYTNACGYSTFLTAQNREKILSNFALVSLVLNVAVVWGLIRLARVPFELVAVGTLFAYTVYVFGISLYSMRMLEYRKPFWRKLIDIFPPSLLLPMLFTAALFCFSDNRLFLLCLPVFLLLNVKNIIKITVLVRQLLVAPQMIDVQYSAPRQNK